MVVCVRLKFYIMHTSTRLFIRLRKAALSLTLFSFLFSNVSPALASDSDSVSATPSELEAVPIEVMQMVLRKLSSSPIQLFMECELIKIIGKLSLVRLDYQNKVMININGV